MTLQIFQRLSPVRVLGPGARAVIWTQGCPFACKGCIVPESWDVKEGETIDLEELARWVFDQPEIEGVTFSGGEPMAQAGALVQLADMIQAKSSLGIMCYTGYTIEHLQQKGTNEQRTLLERIDLLVDGLYIETLHADLLWRGSSNQRLFPLTDRYRSLVEMRIEDRDSSAGLEFHLDKNGVPAIIGVPPAPQFRQTLENSLLSKGVIFKPEVETES